MRADLLSKLIVVDTETTGTDVFTHNILSYAFVPVCDGPVLEGFVDEHHEAVWTDVAKSYFASSEKKWSLHKKSARAAVNEIEHYLASLSRGDLVLVGHNVAFDRYFLEKLARDAGQPYIKGLSHRTIDTHSLLVTLSLMGRIPENATTSSGAFEYFNVSPASDIRHTALGDATATRDLYRKILSQYGV